jgi:riboflavin-specific deaminase-like protein
MQTLSNNRVQERESWVPKAPKLSSTGPIVIAQIGQSLDGQVATATGQSKYINGSGGLRHLHALRAWADAVVVGVGSVVADDPKLTVRLVDGENPMRVVIDPKGRVPCQALLLNDRAAKTVVMTARHVADWPLPAHVTVVPLALDGNGRLSPLLVLQWLEQAGCKRVLVEGGPATIAGFMATNSIDYLHFLTTAVLLGSGKPGVIRPPLGNLNQAQRFRMRSYQLDEDLLIECDLKALA